MTAYPTTPCVGGVGGGGEGCSGSTGPTGPPHPVDQWLLSTITVLVIFGEAVLEGMAGASDTGVKKQG